MPPKMKKSTAGAAPAPKKPKKVKQPNFKPEEDLALSKAFANCTANSISGVDQKATEFWNHVQGKFEVSLEKEVGAAVAKSFPYRDGDSVKNRFTRQIQPDVNKYLKYYRKVKQDNPSGTTLEQIQLIAAEGYNNSGFEKIVPAKRRRHCYCIDEETMLIEVTRGRSEIYDILTHLTFLYIEADKIRDQRRFNL